MKRLIVVAALVLAGEAGAQEFSADMRQHMAQTLMEGYECPPQDVGVGKCVSLKFHATEVAACNLVKDSALRLECYDATVVLMIQSTR